MYASLFMELHFFEVVASLYLSHKEYIKILAALHPLQYLLLSQPYFETARGEKLRCYERFVDLVLFPVKFILCPFLFL
jgi:hypothetical protein